MEAILNSLVNLLEEYRRIYAENGRQDYDAGRIDGLKIAIEEINRLSTSYNDNLRK